MNSWSRTQFIKKYNLASPNQKAQTDGRCFWCRSSFIGAHWLLIDLICFCAKLDYVHSVEATETEAPSNKGGGSVLVWCEDLWNPLSLAVGTAGSKQLEITATVDKHSMLYKNVDASWRLYTCCTQLQRCVFIYRLQIHINVCVRKCNAVWCVVIECSAMHLNVCAYTVLYVNACKYVLMQCIYVYAMYLCTNLSTLIWI